MAETPESTDRDAVTLGEGVYRSLRQSLRAGEFRPGDRLREDDVARRLAVSRTPVREAFGRLLAKRLVEPAGARGLVVRSLGTSEILELYAMREILEGAAARLAAQHGSPPEIDSMRDQQARFERIGDDAASLARINALFHATIVRASRNRYLGEALDDLQDFIALLGPTTFEAEGRSLTAAVEHRAIVDAIADRDSGGAEQAARLHIREALRTRLNLALT